MSSGFLKEASTCRIEVACYVAFYHPLVTLCTVAGESVSYECDGIIGAPVWPESIGVFAKVCFPYRFQGHAKGFLYHPILQCWNAQWPLLSTIWFGYIHPSD